MASDNIGSAHSPFVLPTNQPWFGVLVKNETFTEQVTLNPGDVVRLWFGFSDEYLKVDPSNTQNHLGAGVVMNTIAPGATGVVAIAGFVENANVKGETLSPGAWLRAGTGTDRLKLTSYATASFSSAGMALLLQPTTTDTKQANVFMNIRRK